MRRPSKVSLKIFCQAVANSFTSFFKPARSICYMQVVDQTASQIEQLDGISGNYPSRSPKMPSIMFSFHIKVEAPCDMLNSHAYGFCSFLQFRHVSKEVCFMVDYSIQFAEYATQQVTNYMLDAWNALLEMLSQEIKSF